MGLRAIVPPSPSGLLMKVSLSVWIPTVRQDLCVGSSTVDTPMSRTLLRSWLVMYGLSLCNLAISPSRCDMDTACSPRSWKIFSSKSVCKKKQNLNCTSCSIKHLETNHSAPSCAIYTIVLPEGLYIYDVYLHSFHLTFQIMGFKLSIDLRQ